MTTPRFATSSFCHHGGCVAVAALPDGRVLVRDDKHEESAVLAFTAEEWRDFVQGVKNGEFDPATLGA
ncbi:DUF397 domain-containing protein [Pseudonocardia nigra]|uniref:DUF397 domain-containing protein n=1 Tax=Pseudonocardia nigra TaxID=1921578 RepID=UPI001C5D1105|nr:DUF397 domain-containing protein [Pseudonocardia nigra]